MQRVALGVIAGALGAAAVYALLRIGQAALLGDTDPALIMYSEHAGYFWRAWTAAYAGGMIGFAASLLAHRDPPRVARLLAAVVPIVAALAAAQGVLVP